MKVQRTKQVKAVRWLSTIVLFGTLLTMMFPAGAWAVGTASGTTISNQATISYDVATIAQTPIASDGDGNFGNGPESTDFVVDNLVDLNVSTLDAAPVTVAPGSTVQVIRFQVDNEGNTIQDFLLTAVGQTNGTGPYALPFVAPDDSLDDDFDGTSVRIFVDSDPQAATSGYTPSTWDGVGTETEVSYIDELQADNSVTVYIVIDVPLTATDGQVAVYGMLAQVAQGGGAGAQGSAIASDDSGSADSTGVDIVFGDGIGPDDPDQVNEDGYHSSRSAYRIGSAALAVAKTSAVQWDPINNGTNPKAIPGARILYTITINNTGSLAADNIVLTDAIPADTWFYVDTPPTGGTAAYSNDGGGTYTYAPSSGADGEDQAVTNVQVTVGSVAAAGNATVTFMVIIQ